MYKNIVAIQFVIICLLQLFSYANIDTISYNNSIDNHVIYAIKEDKLVAKVPNSNINLYYVKEDKALGNYVGFILEINGAKKYYKWENVINPSYAPKLELCDLDKDGIEEIVVYLCKGYGTGIYDEEVHVIRQSPIYTDILIENPIIILYKNVRVKEFPEYFEIILKDKEFKVYKKGLLTPPYSKVGIGWGEGNTRYEVKDNTLYAKVCVGANMLNIGELVVKYKYQDEILQMEGHDFFSYRHQ